VTIYVRFSESERYDPLKDCEVARFIATTDKGSYHTEVPIEGTASLRTRRQAFKDLVVEYIRSGRNPCEVRLG
jgi:hypothetical protein